MRLIYRTSDPHFTPPRVRALEIELETIVASRASDPAETWGRVVLGGGNVIATPVVTEDGEQVWLLTVKAPL